MVADTELGQEMNGEKTGARSARSLLESAKCPEVTGRMGFVLDRHVPGELFVALKRSEVAHAKIARVSVEAAKRRPGVVAVLTAEEIDNCNRFNPTFGPVLADEPVLAKDRTRYAGEPIVAVAATSSGIATAALDDIEIDYESLPAVFDVEESLRDGAPVLHGEVRPGFRAGLYSLGDRSRPNVCAEFRLRRGDIDKAFEEAQYVFDDTFTNPAVQHVPMETHGCVVDISDGTYTIWAGTQMPFALQTELSRILGVPTHSVRVIVPPLGGAYGGKCYSRIEPIACIVAAMTGRPVKLQISRAEEFATLTKHAARIRLKTAVSGEGKITARYSTCEFDAGAYADISPQLAKSGGLASIGPYNIPNTWVDSVAVYTNNVPAGAFRGFGVSQAAWAYETQMDMIANRLGADPLDFRLQNVLRSGDPVMSGAPVGEARFVELLESARLAIDWSDGRPPEHRTTSKARGKGVACTMKHTMTPSTSSATARLNADGSLTIGSGSVDMGQRIGRALGMVASAELSLPVESVRVSTPDSMYTPYDQQTSSSRSAFSMGNAVIGAVSEIREQLLSIAGDQLEVDAHDLELVDGSIRVKGSTDTVVSICDVLAHSGVGTLLGRGTFSTEGGLDPDTGLGVASVHWHQAVGAAEVEVDLETGRVKVVRYHAGAYAGKVIDPINARLQVEGNVTFGIGQALYEELVSDNGVVVNPNLSDYAVPNMADMPPALSIDLQESAETCEVHGLGETTLPPVMAAIGNAIYNATGVRVTSLPIRPSDILAGLAEVGGDS